MTEYTQGVCEDGAAIIKDGQMLTIEQILDELRQGVELQKQQQKQQAKLAGGQSVAEVIPNVVGVEMAWIDPRNKPPVGTKLYTSPPPQPDMESIGMMMRMLASSVARSRGLDSTLYKRAAELLKQNGLFGSTLCDLDLEAKALIEENKWELYVSSQQPAGGE